VKPLKIPRVKMSSVVSLEDKLKNDLSLTPRHIEPMKKYTDEEDGEDFNSVKNDSGELSKNPSKLFGVDINSDVDKKAFK
jgi:hypothetical protein